MNEVLDFFTWRSESMFDDWTPQSSQLLAAALSGRDWEELLVENLINSPAFASDIVEARRRAPRELERRRIPAAPQVTRGRLRGRPLLRRSLIERVRRQDSTVWVVDRRPHVFQTDHNAALVGFLQYICTRAEKAVEQSPFSARVTTDLEALLKTYPLRGVRGDPQWASQELPPTLLAKSPVYRIIWRWAQYIRRSRDSRDASALRIALTGWLRDLNEDRLFELFAFSRIVIALHGSRSWSSFRFQRSPANVVASDTGLSTMVILDRTPLVSGHYAWLLSRYSGIDGRGRRPDIQLVTSVGDERRTTFVEVKNTEPNTQYGRDSVVKVLGYLKDYDDLWPPEAPPYPHAMLLYPSGLFALSPIESRSTDEVILSTAQTLDNDIVCVIDRHARV